MTADMPLGVRIISIIINLISITALIGGIYLLIRGILWSGPGDKTQIGEWTFIGLSSTAIYSGIIFIILGVTFILFAIGLWKGKNWARYWLSVFALIGFIAGIVGIIRNLSNTIYITGSLIQVIITGLVAWYLMRKDIKGYFS